LLRAARRRGPADRAPPSLAGDLTAGLVFGATETCIATPSGSVSHKPSFGPSGCAARPKPCCATRRASASASSAYIPISTYSRRFGPPPWITPHTCGSPCARKLERVAAAAHVEPERLVELLGLVERRDRQHEALDRMTPVAPDRRFRVSLPCIFLPPPYER
jgi:hypothetical protein